MSKWSVKVEKKGRFLIERERCIRDTRSYEL